MLQFCLIFKVKELSDAFAACTEKPQQQRFLRSQQNQKQDAVTIQNPENGNSIFTSELIMKDDVTEVVSADVVHDQAPTIDAYDLADPVDVLSKLPGNFFDQLVLIHL
jgi:hypothetical protein